ncbi:MAG TPA: acyl-CoA dehydrogenase family protein [Acetobacteraceae bacterium]|nr:acyl-CoA dehydrogenase family protein [Acetobacteraceae bacterium]
MDFSRDPADEAFRAEVRAFLKAHLPAELAARVKLGYHPLKADTQFWTSVLHERGWSVPHWPVEYGGPGFTPLQRHIFEEECFLAGAPVLSTQGPFLVGPVIYTFGSQAQKDRYLPGIRSGAEFWGQGFSEPNAGSDLVSLKTRAVREGDHYIVNGQKTWSSEANLADQVFFLARTDPDAKPQKGISFFLIDAMAPGVTIRPIISLDDGHSLNEIYFDNVRVPVENRVGEEGKGWSYAKFLLENERAFSAEVPRNKRYFARLRDIAIAEKRHGAPLIADPRFAARMAEAKVALESLEFLTLSALYESGDTASARPIGSVLKIRGSELQQLLLEMTAEALGAYATAFYPEPWAERTNAYPPGPAYAPGAVGELYYRRAATIYGGSNEIQRNIIAKQILGL